MRSIAASDNEKVYVGGVNELGYLAPDAVGTMKYHSLKSFLKEEQSEFRDVWSIQVIGDLVYFENGTHIFRWDGTAFKVFAPEVAFGSLYKVNNEIYVESKGVGILKVDGDTLQLIQNGELVNNERAKTDLQNFSTVIMDRKTYELGYQYGLEPGQPSIRLDGTFYFF